MYSVFAECRDGYTWALAYQNEQNWILDLVLPDGLCEPLLPKREIPARRTLVRARAVPPQLRLDFGNFSHE